MEVDFHERLRKGYQVLAATDPERYVLLIASLPPGVVTQSVLHQLYKRLKL